ncbi:MAG: XRE family transcriptional regulator [Alphaproteobacteria bacterium]|nr:XRE family transcriptional regulator [Alphaproteobacteria bacterium]
MTSESLQEIASGARSGAYHSSMGRPWYVVAKTLAKQREISYQSMADRLGVSKATVGHWFTGRNRATLDVIKEIARMLDVPLTELVAEDAYYLTDEHERALIERYRKIPPELRKHAAKILDGLVPKPEDPPSES